MKILFGCLAFQMLSLSVLTQTVPVSLDSYLKSAFNKNVIPGFSVVVVKENKVIFSKGYGVERIGSNKPFTPTSVIAIGSLTKSFTALAALKLVEKGKLNLDSPVVKYLPWFRTANRDQSDKITMRMLLSNTSGLYPSTAMPIYNLSEVSMEVFVKNLSSIYLYKEPGNSYEYSNAGFVVAGLVISKISGISYASFLNKEIFEPFHMSHTTTDPGDFEMMNIIPGHYASINAAIVAKREPQFETGEYIPAGSLLQSCADDIGNYLIALMNENTILNNNIRKNLWSPNTYFPGLSKEDGGDGKPFGYGLGWMISSIEGRKIIHHGGSTGKTSSFTMIDTANKIAATILMNIDMTFIDKYAYATEFNILNNVMRMAEGFPISEFGKPIVKDPTLNEFELKEKNEDNYTGEYNFRGGGDAWVYFGIDMKIQKTPAGELEGIIYRGSQVVNRFLLDFINESIAVSRNVAMPAYIKFKLTPARKVTSVFFNDIELSKRQNEISESFTEFTSVFRQVSFSLPKEWQCDFRKPGFSAATENRKALLKGNMISKGEFSFDSLFKSNCGSLASATSESQILFENFGTFIWQQKTYLFKRGDENVQCMILFTENSSTGYWFILISPKTEFTFCVQQAANSLLKSFRVQ